MPLSKSHKQATRQKIIEAAGRLFREKGYEGVGIAGIMADVGLTRGGFYAHFWSKASLFREVIRSREGIVSQLGNQKQLKSKNTVLHQYLSPDHLEQSRKGCTLASLSADVARSGAITRQAYTKVFKELLRELDMNEEIVADDESITVAVLLVGGVMLAGALSDEKLATRMLDVCRAEIDSRID